jgi:ABC-type proline/glycine betaine transport system ATPase subunit
VTHDVDEALLLADRIVLMTNGPAATVGEIVTVPFARPRVRLTIIDHPEYHQARKQLLSFLEDEATPGRTLSPFDARQAAVANRTVTAEELFVIEKYTGFNRFRKKYCKQPAKAEPVERLNQAEAKAL